MHCMSLSAHLNQTCNLWDACEQATPSQLGYLTLSRAIVQALVSPVGGFLGGPPLIVASPCGWAELGVHAVRKTAIAAPQHKHQHWLVI